VDIVATVNSYCSAGKGRCAATLVLYADGTTRLFGEPSLARATMVRLRTAVVPDSEPAPVDRDPGQPFQVQRTGRRGR
jgi:hypothetical protein